MVFILEMGRAKFWKRRNLGDKEGGSRNSEGKSVDSGDCFRVLEKGKIRVGEGKERVTVRETN